MIAYDKVTIKKPGGATVYGGPSTDFMITGSVYEDETVWVVWRSGYWYYIEYYVPSTKKYKSGYVLDSGNHVLFGYVVTNRAMETTNAGWRYAIRYSDTYYGISSDYAQAGYINQGEAVFYLGEKHDGYAFIEYTATAGKKRRAWVTANDLATSPQVK